jgi:hypothetical protein
MITIAGAVKRTFTFPARLPVAFDFFADARRSLALLPHISVQKQYGEDRFRLMYHTVELGIYPIYMACDINVTLDRKNWILDILPLKGIPPLPNEAGIYSITGHGLYTSRSIFIDNGGDCRVDYQLELHARLPKPLVQRLIPDIVLNPIANTVVEWRIDEIVSGFIRRSIELYQSESTVALSKDDTSEEGHP